MKTIKASLWLSIVLLIVSCSDEGGTLYDNPEGKVYVSFASSKYTAELLPEDGNSISVSLSRSVAKEAMDVEVRFTTNSSLFTMPDSVFHFAAGESVAKQTISYPGAEGLGAGASYALKLSVKDTTLVSVGGKRDYALNLSRQLTWIDAGTGIWTDGLVCAIFSVQPLSYEVELQHAEEAPQVYRMVNPYGLGVYPYTEEGDIVKTNNPCYMIIDATNHSQVKMPSAGLGIDWTYGEIFMGMLSNKYGTFSNGTITFPAEYLAVGMRNYNGGNLAFLAKECKLELLIP